MNKQQQLKDLVHKAILPACGDCGGSGYYQTVFLKTGIKHTEEDQCKTCSGRGFIIPLEFGCDLISPKGGRYMFLTGESDRHVLYNSMLYFYGIDEVVSKCERFENWEILGKPTTYQSLLLALNEKNIEVSLGNKDLYILIVVAPLKKNEVPKTTSGLIQKKNVFYIDLKKPVEEQEPDVLEALIKILS